MGQEFGRHLRERSSSGCGSAPLVMTGTLGQRGETDVTGAGVARVILEDVRGSLISHINL